MNEYLVGLGFACPPLLPLNPQQGFRCVRLVTNPLSSFEKGDKEGVATDIVAEGFYRGWLWEV